MLVHHKKGHFMKTSTKLSIAFTAMALSTFSCGRFKKSDDDTKPDVNPNKPTVSLVSDVALIGTWSNVSNQDGFNVEQAFKIAADSTGQHIVTVGTDEVISIDAKFASDGTVTPHQFDVTVTKVNKDSSDDAFKAGDVMHCIYQLTGTTELKLNCSEKNKAGYPAAFGEDDLTLTKK